VDSCHAKCRFATDLHVAYEDTMSRYATIDPTLSDWAIDNSVQWYSDYQDTEVRTFYINPKEKDRVQISVDAPREGRTIIRIGQLQRGSSRLARTSDFTTTISDLSSALDRALQAANEWLMEDRHQT